MKTCLVVGRTNVGKTMFCLNFAEYLGLKKLEVYDQLPDGTKRQRKYDIREARHELSGLGQHKTRALQSIELDLPRKKGKSQFLLTDSTGLSDGIHPNEDIRKSMAQTLHEIQSADVILHVVDLAGIGRSGGISKQGELDSQIADLGAHKNGYALLGNKIDLPDAKTGLIHIKQELGDVRVIPMSALYRQGFREVKEYVWRLV